MDSNENAVGIEVFGGNAEPSTTTATQTAPQPTEESDTVVFGNTKVKPEAEQETPQPKADKPKVEPKPAEAPKPEEAAKTETAPKKEIEVSFRKPEEPKSTPTDAKKETLSVTEDMVISFLKDKNIDVDSLGELTKKEVLSDEVAEFKKFQEETKGRGLKDFYNMKKDWKSEPKESTIREFYKFKHPNLSDEDIDTNIELIKVTEEDQDFLSERELKKRNLEFNTVYSEALDYMTKKSAEYSTPTDNKTPEQKPMTQEQIEQAYKPYWDKRDQSLKNLNDVSISLGEVGNINLSVTQKQKDIISKHTQTQEAYFERWKNDEGVIDTDKSSLDTMWSIPEIREELIADTIEQAFTLFMDNYSKKNRNVDLADIKDKTAKTEKQGGLITFGGTQEESRMGKPIF